VNATSSLERHYARATFLVAGVGLLATSGGRGPGDESPAVGTDHSDRTESFATTLRALSAEDRPSSETGPTQERSLSVVA